MASNNKRMRLNHDEIIKKFNRTIEPLANESFKECCPTILLASNAIDKIVMHNVQQEKKKKILDDPMTMVESLNDTVNLIDNVRFATVVSQKRNYFTISLDLSVGATLLDTPRK